MPTETPDPSPSVSVEAPDPSAGDDLIEQLRGPEGARVRVRLLDQLADLALRLEKAKRSGLAPEAYTRVQVALAAVESAKSTLDSIRVDSSAGAVAPAHQPGEKSR